MKRFILLAAMLSAPAYATNILYAPVPDPKTQQPSILYLTDMHSGACKGKWFKSDIVNTASKKSSLISDICWTYLPETGFSLWVPSTGVRVDNFDSLAIVPGAESVYKNFVHILNAEIQRETDAYTAALRNANPHP